MRLVDARLPFAVQLPPGRDLELPNDAPNVDGTDRVPTDEGEGGEEVEAGDLEPKAHNWMLLIRETDLLLRVGVQLALQKL